jgi:hypothetical protein
MRAVQEHHAELGLELADLLAHCRLGDVEPLRRAPEVKLLGDGDEVAEMSQFHAMKGALYESPGRCEPPRDPDPMDPTTMYGCPYPTRAFSGCPYIRSSPPVACWSA